MTRPTVAGSTIAWIVVVLGLAVILVLRLTGTAVPDQLWVVIAAAVPAGSGSVHSESLIAVVELRALVESLGRSSTPAVPSPPLTSQAGGEGTAGPPPFAG